MYTHTVHVQTHINTQGQPYSIQYIWDGYSCAHMWAQLHQSRHSGSNTKMRTPVTYLHNMNSTLRGYSCWMNVERLDTHAWTRIPLQSGTEALSLLLKVIAIRSVCLSSCCPVFLSVFLWHGVVLRLNRWIAAYYWELQLGGIHGEKMILVRMLSANSMDIYHCLPGP